MRRFILVLLLSVTAFAAEPIVQPIPELTLTNGTIFRNVTIIRYDSSTVVLKSSAGTGPLQYTMIPEPLRTAMLAERDKAKAADAAKSAKAGADAMAAIEKDQAHAASSKARAEKIEEAIRKQTLLVGMTRDQATKSWGEPSRKNKSGGATGATEQWVYSRQSGMVYVYFRDGLLSSWQTSETRR